MHFTNEPPASLVIPASVTAIGDYAFVGCSSLTSVEIPASVTHIGNRAFYGCHNLKEIIVDSDNPAYSSIDGVLFNREKSILICCPGGFTGTFIFPPSVTSIGDYAFDGCRGLASVEIPHDVTSIGNYALSGCEGLTSVDIPASVTHIGTRAFSGCTSLTSVVIPNSINSINEKAFSGCDNLKTIYYLAADLIEGDANIFTDKAYKNATLYVLENGFGKARATYPWKNFVNIECIPTDIVYRIIDAENLLCEVSEGTNAAGDVLIPSKVKINSREYTVVSVGENAFINCVYLTSVKIPSSVTAIGNRAFYECYALTSVEIPGSVTSIGVYAFGCCEGLSFVEIPASVISIGDYAFIGCRGLTSVKIPGSVTSIGNRAFSACRNLKGIVVDSDNPAYSSIDGVLFNREKSILICCPGGLSGEYIIPDTVTSIDYAAFIFCKALTSVVIPHSVISIGEWAFSYCSALTSLVISNSVTSIGEKAFYPCNNLEKVHYLSPNPVEGEANIFSNGAYQNATLYVSRQGYAKAKTIDPWKNFKHIEVCDAEGITDAAAAPPPKKL